MTHLSRKVKRISDATVREAGRPRAIVVIISPPGTISFRAKGCRRTYSLDLETCYTMAVRAHVEAEKKKRKQKRKKARQ